MCLIGKTDTRLATTCCIVVHFVSFEWNQYIQSIQIYYIFYSYTLQGVLYIERLQNIRKSGYSKGKPNKSLKFLSFWIKTKFYVFGLMASTTMSTVLLANLLGNTRSNNSSANEASGSIPNQVFNEGIQLLYRDTRHHNYVRDVPQASELPFANERVIGRPFEHHGSAELVQHNTEPCLSQPVLKIASILKATPDVFPEASIALPIQCVPHE